MTLRIGLGINLGNLLTPVLLKWAAELRGWGVGHCCYANYPVDTIAVAKGDTAKVQADADKAITQLNALAALGMTVGVRPLPMILEQIKEQVPVAPPPTLNVLTFLEVTTPNFSARNTSIEAARLLLPGLGDHNIAAQHEVHDTSDGHIRSWVTNQLGPATMFYYGRAGLWNKYSVDFGEHDAPHVVYVALNAAGVGDASAPGALPGPADCTPADIRHAVEMFDYRINATINEDGSSTFPRAWKFQFHINFLADASVDHIVRMLAAARIGFQHWNVGMVRLVDEHGNTLREPAPSNRHAVTPNVLQAIKECAAWMT
jgi:hypothetical protein